MMAQSARKQQVSPYYNEEQGIIRRTSAPPGQRAYPTTHAPATTKRQTSDGTHVGLTPKSGLAYRSLDRAYVIHLDNGDVLKVTEHELSTMPQEYQDAAQLVTPQLPAATTRARREPHPKRPVDDETVYAMPPARSPFTNDQRDTEVPPSIRGRKKHTFSLVRAHPLFFLGLGMVLALGVWIGGGTFLAWWSIHTDDQTYGRPRTFQTDAVVGHNGDSAASPSHFIAINLNRHIEIIELPAGDASKAKIYIGPTLYGDGQDLTPVTLSFKDLTGNGKLDMIVRFAGSFIVFLNENGTFRPLKPGEKVNV